MPVVAILGLAAIVWGAVYARRGSLAAGCALLLVVGYVFGHEFWNSRLGPLPLTLDRVLLTGLIVAAVVQWRIGRLKFRPLTAADWAVLALVGVAAASAAMSGHTELSDGVNLKWGRLLTSFLIPAALYLIVRQLAVSPREARWLLGALVALGVYLAITGILEVGEAWAWVFPRYIADPAVGIHFGRARGPEVNAVSLGMYLTAAITCAWTLLRQTSVRWQQLLVLTVMPLMALTVFLTYTRSTWLGLTAGAIVIAAFEIPRRWRWPALGTVAIASLLLMAASWSQLLGLTREGTSAEAEHSVNQRKSFAYVSWQMFCDHPLLGVGFGRFYDRKLPYLSDRSQSFELESIRPLHHHNTFLSFLTEMGIIGVAALLALLAIWARCAYRLAAIAASRWNRAFGVLTLALLTNYLCSALFHDLTLIPSQHVLLFAFAGLAVNLRQRELLEAYPKLRASVRESVESDGKPSVELFGIRICRITMNEAVAGVLHWCGQPHQGICRYVVTPNVDHTVLFQTSADLRAAYAAASLVLADGAPIVLTSRLLGKALPERVAGSDLVPRLFTAARGKLRVFLLGAAPGVAEIAARRIEDRWPNVKVVGTYSPPLGFESKDIENTRVVAAINAAYPDLLILGLGAPKQELWIHGHRDKLRANVAICAGATIDFLAGHRRRSPVWMQRAGLEWLHRASSEPRRLAGRYARDAWIFPRLIWREWWRAGA